MAKKVIRLTEAKITEMAVEVARRALKEGIWNNFNNTIQRTGDTDRITPAIVDKEADVIDLQDYKRDLDDIRMDTDYVNGNPEAFKQAWNYLVRCCNQRYNGNDERDSMMDVIDAYIKQYEEYARQEREKHMHEPLR